MLVYKFPPKITTTEQRLNNLNAKTETKKMNKSIIKNTIIAMVIVILATQINPLWLKLIVLIIGFTSLATAFVLRKITGQQIDNEFSTKIYADKIEQNQSTLILPNRLKFSINFDDILESKQDLIGNLQITLKSENNSKREVLNRKGEIISVGFKNNIAVLSFPLGNGKWILIDNYPNEIKYKRSSQR